MTAHTHDATPTRRSKRPRWLIPVLLASALAITLVLGGILPASVVLYAASMGGMLLMHLGGHGGHGSGHDAHTDPVPEGEQPAASPDERRGGCH